MIEEINITLKPKYTMGDVVVSQCEWKAKVNGEWYGDHVEFTDNPDYIAETIINLVTEQMWRALEKTGWGR